MPIVQAILETIEADMTKAQIVGISQVLKCFKHPKDPKGKSFLNDRPSFQYKRNDQLLFNWHQLSAVRRLIRYRLTPLQSVTIRDTYPLIPHDSNVSPWFALCPAKKRPGNTSHRVTRLQGTSDSVCTRSHSNSPLASKTSATSATSGFRGGHGMEQVGTSCCLKGLKLKSFGILKAKDRAETSLNCHHVEKTETSWNVFELL